MKEKNFYKIEYQRAPKMFVMFKLSWGRSQFPNFKQKKESEKKKNNPVQTINHLPRLLHIQPFIGIGM